MRVRGDSRRDDLALRDLDDNTLLLAEPYAWDKPPAVENEECG